MGWSQQQHDTYRATELWISCVSISYNSQHVGYDCRHWQFCNCSGKKQENKTSFCVLFSTSKDYTAMDSFLFNGWLDCDDWSLAEAKRHISNQHQENKSIHEGASLQSEGRVPILLQLHHRMHYVSLLRSLRYLAAHLHKICKTGQCILQHSTHKDCPQPFTTEVHETITGLKLRAGWMDGKMKTSLSKQLLFYMEIGQIQFTSLTSKTAIKKTLFLGWVFCVYGESALQNLARSLQSF